MFNNTIVLKEWFNESLDKNDASRKLARKTLEYKEGEQLADSIKMKLTIKGQPEQYENNIEKFDTKIVGFQETRQTQIGIDGRQTQGYNEKEHQDDLTARILKDTVRYIKDEYELDETKEISDEDLRFSGMGVQEVKIKDTGEKDSFGRPLIDVYYVNIPSSESFPDPYAKSKDYWSDARYFTRAFFTDIDSLYAMGFSEDKIKQLHTGNYLDSSLDEDTGSFAKHDRYLLCYTWFKKLDRKTRKYKYYYCYWCDNIILEQKESPFNDVPNFEGCPIIVSWLRKKANRTGKIAGYSGIYKHLLPLQDAINHAKLRLHGMLGNIKLLIQSDALPDDMTVEMFSDEWSLDDAVVEIENINGIKDIKQHVEYQQIMSLIVDARNQLKEILGFNDELLAIANNRLSGDAIAKRLSTGTYGLADYFKASMRLQKRTIKKMIPLICHFFDATRVVAIIEADDSRRYFTINEPDLDENGYINYEDAGDGFVVPKMKNKITVGKYDLIYTEEPKETSSATERFRLNIEMIKELGKYSPELAMTFAPEAYSDYNAPLAERLKGMLENIKNTQGQEPTQKQKLELAEIAVAIKEKNAKADYWANKPNIEIANIESRNSSSMQSNQIKREKNLIDSTKGMSHAV